MVVMIVVVVVIMAMAMVMVVMGMAVGMRVAVVVVLLPIGAAFGVERHADMADMGAEALQHVDDDMVVTDEQLLPVYLGR